MIGNLDLGAHFPPTVGNPLRVLVGVRSVRGDDFAAGVLPDDEKGPDIEIRAGVTNLDTGRRSSFAQDAFGWGSPSHVARPQLTTKYAETRVNGRSSRGR